MSFLVGLDLNDVQVQTDSGNASTTAFTLDVAATTNSVAAYISGVRQLSGTDFTVSGTTITFTTAPPSGTNNIAYYYTKPAIINTPADNSVTTAKIVNNAVDETKLKDALIADFTEVTIAAGDSILLGDVGDSGNTKRDTVQGLLDLAGGGFTLGTEQAATSGTSVTFTGIPSGTTMIIVMLEAVSFTAGAGTDLDLTIGDSGGLETSGYVSTGASVLAGLTFVSSTASFVVDNDSDGDTWSGQFFLTLKDSSNFTWICSHSFKGDIGGLNIGAGDKSLSAELTQLSLSGGTFDGAGSINIMYQ